MRPRQRRASSALASHVKGGLPENEPFIYPLVIDDVPRDSPEIDGDLRALNWDGLEADGSLPAPFIDRLRKAYRRAQLRGIRG